jgi:L-alanine-DL-glutamate epimerase-like enolase superfamily enzyme
MRILEIRECTIPLKSNIRNSSFDFSEMTTSVVAVRTDVLRDGKPVTGFAFNSTGRYAYGATMRARFIPRILAADPHSLLDEAKENFDPSRILAILMQQEKSGGHSERSIAIGTIEVALWDAVAKIAGKPLHRLLAERRPRGLLLCERRLVFPRAWMAPPGVVSPWRQSDVARHCRRLRPRRG